MIPDEDLANGQVSGQDVFAIRYLEIVDNACLPRILGYFLQGRAQRTVLRHGFHLRALPSVRLHRRLHWFGHAERRPAGEINREVINPEPRTHLDKKRGGQLNAGGGSRSP